MRFINRSINCYELYVRMICDKNTEPKFNILPVD